ncbi:MAG: PepSY1/2 domain-containing protein [Candidatus Caccovivens sp.]
MKKEKNDNIQRKNRYKGAVIGLSIATGVLGLSTLGFGIAYGVMNAQAMEYSIQLENIYKKNFYELVDSVNTADTNISKLLASDDETYQAKMLGEVSQSAKEMQSSVAMLPLSSDNILTTVRFVNQMSGYTQILQKKVDEGGTLTEQDIKVLNQMHDALTEMKLYLNRMSTEMINGYSILEASSRMNGDYDEFSSDFAQIKTEGSDYPTMIYDGPFSDSVVNQQVKGLSGEEISKEDAYKKVDDVFKNVSNIKYQGQTDGKFNTYNFNLQDSDGQTIYVQVTKIGGHILTVSGGVESDNKTISFEQAEKIALDFAKANGIENVDVVWSEELKSQAYFNIAPKLNNMILYPDLVKVKVDMEHGNVVGYDAITYFTNHTGRTLSQPSISQADARAKIDNSFEIKNERVVLAPLDYNREVVCYEFECERGGATYYIYINASTGAEENILKVVETDDGSKLM